MQLAGQRMDPRNPLASLVDYRPDRAMRRPSIVEPSSFDLLLFCLVAVHLQSWLIDVGRQKENVQDGGLVVFDQV